MTSRFDDHALFPGAAEAAVQQYDIYREGVGPKCPVDHVEHKGVLLTSRWSVASEIRLMQSAVEKIPEILRRRISSIWCDSYCGCHYRVTLQARGCSPALVNALASAFKGNNGIHIDERDSLGNVTRVAELDPDWNASL